MPQSGALPRSNLLFSRQLPAVDLPRLATAAEAIRLTGYFRREPLLSVPAHHFFRITSIEELKVATVI